MATKLVDERPATEPLKDRSTAELLKRLSDQVRNLVQQEIRLAKAELTEKGKRAGKGAGMLGAAALVGLYAVGVLLATIILALATVMPAWLSALIVTVVLLVVAGVLALMGRAQTRKATPAAPARTMESVKKDVQVVREHAHR
ncbi:MULTISPECIES: phage holin family protein [Thermomonospora]|uniref:Putative membrane protein YqjE n=1 Tax=Thermomonospora cellulosilytica TaxID=1411118 RepID=A0A7W3MZE1_9ACTN|nr:MULTISPECIES: phage holin family protein [Thermomonospora]MBA9004689.1 putative membrane protein YqjE [Thermomonospora cellulosilytica]